MKNAAAVELRGIVVNKTTRVTDKRPVATLRARLYALKRGMAYPLDAVAKEWCVSPETVRRHAGDAECYRFVETAPETWTPCVMHPDTAKQYPVK